MTSRQYIKLAESLPPRLTRFFARYPPPALLNPGPTNAPPSSSTTTTPSSDRIDQITQGISQLSTSAAETPNPFVREKHPITGRWHDPVFSLRRQAELVKLARQHGVEELLPFTVKATQERKKRRAENGLRVKGTGVGQKVKGKEAERTMRARYVVFFLFYNLLWGWGTERVGEDFLLITIRVSRLEKRRQAMLNMPRMIQEWKQVRFLYLPSWREERC